MERHFYAYYKNENQELKTYNEPFSNREVCQKAANHWLYYTFVEFVEFVGVTEVVT